MSYTALARKWRPRSFDEVVGQRHVVRALSNALDSGRMHHALLFTGTRGVGKTTLARIIARCLNCEQGESASPCGECGSCLEIESGRFVDLIEVDAASRTKVDDTRELLENVQYAPSRGRCKVYLIDEVHMLSKHSFNALLKTLEEPPSHVKFLLATTDPQKLPVTILSRCLQFNLKRLPAAEIREHLSDILGREGIDVDVAALRVIAEAAEGSMRDAMSLLDQAIAHCGGSLEETAVLEMLGFVQRSQVVDLVRALADRNPGAVHEVLLALEAQAPDYEVVLGDLCETLQRVALLQQIPDAMDEDRDHAIADLPALCDPQDVQLFYEIAVLGRRDIRWTPDPRIGFEMSVLRMLAFQPVDDSEPQRAAPALQSDAGSNKAGTSRSTAADPPATASQAKQAAAPATVTPDDDWATLQAQLPVQGLAAQLAQRCVIGSREGDRWTLWLQSGFEKLNTASSCERLQAALNKVLEREISLQVEVRDAEADSPAQVREADLERQRNSAVSAIKSDPVVSSLQERFGATVRDESIEPDQANNPGDPDGRVDVA